MVDVPEPTKLHYLDGKPAEITLRRCQIELFRGDSVETHTFDRDIVNIGAAEDNDIVIDDDTVSRYHCRIFQESNHYLVRDLGSTNGTFVNRVRVREGYLEPGSIVSLGAAEMRFDQILRAFARADPTSIQGTAWSKIGSACPKRRVCRM